MAHPENAFALSQPTWAPSRSRGLPTKLLGCVAHGFATGALLITSYGNAVAAPDHEIKAVGIENEYADVVSQIGGQYVDTNAVESNPNTDPHTFEASPAVAHTLASANLVVENGVGYDAWADKMLAANSSRNRKVINVQHVLGLPDSTPNPHLWFDPKTMPAVAKAIAESLSDLQPAHAAYFEANLKSFDVSLQRWKRAISRFDAQHPNVPVAVTEPVADYLLQAMGMNIKTPFSFQAAIMNGTDPSPQDVTTEKNLFKNHQVKVFVYNRQVTDSLTDSLLVLAKRNHIPVVGVYETMPRPGFNYQSWMMAEVKALRQAVVAHQSTAVLKAGLKAGH